ncbi:MAG: aminoacyl-tRNA hydrolase [Clostridiales bacterium]|nr:aminoacyl-tRNA hydrolase [Clostridiales bacterium]
MYLVAGLGNPGREYNMTRHNIGFHTIDYIADKLGIKVNKLKYKALWGEANINGEKVLLIKPQTYMNNSGESLMEFVSFYKVPIENLIVINDDISIEAGRLRIRPKGSAGGHNGLKSIIYLLKSDEFVRIKMGVGAPQSKEYDLADYVLGHFTKEEIPIMEDAIVRAAGAVEEIIKNGAASAMNKYNQR